MILSFEKIEKIFNFFNKYNFFKNKLMKFSQLPRKIGPEQHNFNPGPDFY